jgi:ketosteroid isomerase-like protein
MIDRERAEGLAREWLDAWNAHDPERVVAHFAADVTVSSPLLAQLRPPSTGVIHGKDEVLDYYREGLAAVGDLRFEMIEVCTGVAEVVIVYRNHRGVIVTESLEYAGDEVRTVRVAYGA